MWFETFTFKLKKILGTFAIGACLSFAPAIHCIADTPFVANQNGEKMIVELLQDDAGNYLSGSDALVDWAAAISVQRVSAQKYFADYEANGLSANQKYLKKNIYIFGQISSINDDDPNSPYVEFATSDPINTVDAFLDSSAISAAAKYTTGSTVALYCVGSGMLVISPQLTDCIDSSMFVHSLNESIQSMVDDWLDGKDKNFLMLIPSQDRHSFAIIYFAAAATSDLSKCPDFIASDRCLDSLEQYYKANKSILDSEYLEYQSYLGLP